MKIKFGREPFVNECTSNYVTWHIFVPPTELRFDEKGFSVWAIFGELVGGPKCDSIESALIEVVNRIKPYNEKRKLPL